MAVARNNAGGIGAGVAVIEAILLQAVVILLAGDVLAVHIVVRPIAVAEGLAVDVHPEGLVGGELMPLKIAAALTPGDALSPSEGKAFIALAAFLTAVHTDRANGEGFTGFRADHALLKVAVLRTHESWRQQNTPSVNGFLERKASQSSEMGIQGREKADPIAPMGGGRRWWCRNTNLR